MLRAGWGGDCVSQCLWKPMRMEWSFTHLSQDFTSCHSSFEIQWGLSLWLLSVQKSWRQASFHNVSILFLRDSSQKYFARYKESGLEPMIAMNGYHSIKVQILKIVWSWIKILYSEPYEQQKHWLCMHKINNNKVFTFSIDSHVCSLECKYPTNKGISMKKSQQTASG